MKNIKYYQQDQKQRRAKNNFNKAACIALDKISRHIKAASNAHWEQIITDLRKSVKLQRCKYKSSTR